MFNLYQDGYQGTLPLNIQIHLAHQICVSNPRILGFIELMEPKITE